LWKAASLLRGGAGKGWTTVSAISAISYYYFEHLVWTHFRAQLEGGKFDVVHRITPLSPTTPSPLAKKCRRLGIPFVLGPLNGGVPWPKWFQKERRREKEWLAPFRAAYKLMPGHAATYRCSNAIIVGSQATSAQLNPRYRDKTFYVAENAISLERFPPVERAAHNGPLRLLFVGRLVPYKGADMVLEAARLLLASGRVQLTIVGDGPELQHLEQMAETQCVSQAVKFLGNVPHEAVYRSFAEADVFTFPSIREFGGAVVMEAMAMGCVPVVVNYGGPAELVSPQTAFALEIGDRQHIVDQLRSRLDALCVDRSCLTAMAQAGMERARTEFTWEAKARQIAAIYEWALGRGEKPSCAVGCG
jgi:glycosyltransferase involved in cell wall biosynthesis